MTPGPSTAWSRRPTGPAIRATRPGPPLPHRHADFLRGRGDRRAPGQLRDHPAGRRERRRGFGKYRPTASERPQPAAPCRAARRGRNDRAQNGIQYTTTSATAPAGKAFTIAFDNQDSGTPHNVSIHTGGAAGQQVFLGKIVTGPIVEVYDVPALAAGSYTYVCSVHANMTGTLTVK